MSRKQTMYNLLLIIIKDTVTGQSLPIVKESCFAGAIGAEPLGAAASVQPGSKVVTADSDFK